jgi:quinol monooxygenase YgiN
VATALARIRVRPGMEARFERLAATLYEATHDTETAVRRYEYFRGAEPGTYYCLLSFDDYHGFIAHQASEHHEDASPQLRELTESIGLEWLEPLQRASGLAPTEVQPLPADASSAAMRHHERYAGIGEEWWRDLREAEER